MYLLSKCELIMKKNTSNFIIQYDVRISQKRLKCGFSSIHFRYLFTKQEKNRHRIRVSLLPQGYCGEGGGGFQENPIKSASGLSPAGNRYKARFPSSRATPARDLGSGARRVDFLMFLRSCGPKHKKIHGTSEHGFQKTHLFKGDSNSSFRGLQ